MLAVSPRIYAQAVWQLWSEAPERQRLLLFERVAQDLVRRYKRPQRERILRALADQEEANRGVRAVRAWTASDALTQELRTIFKEAPLTITSAPSLKKGVILEQGEFRVDASLKGRLAELKRVLIS